MNKRSTIKPLYYITTILIILTSACNPNQKVDNYLSQFKISSIPTATLTFDSLLATAMDIHVLDSMLMINEFRRSGHLVSFWDKHTAKLIKRKFPVGKGPGEFMPPLYFEYHKDTIGIYNRTDYKYRTYVFDSNLNPIKLTETAPFPSYPAWVKRISDTVFLGTQRISYLNTEQERPERLSLLNHTGQVLKGIKEDYPIIKTNIKINPRLQSLIFQGSRELNPDRTKLAIASVDLGSMEIFEVNNSSAHKSFEHMVDEEVHISKYSDNSTRYVKFSDEQVRGFADIFTTEDGIYLLYAGESAAMKVRKGYRFILFTDWNGRPIRGYELDRPVVCFTIDQPSNVFYGISYDFDQLITAQL